ncbi:hypothetical protein VOLCADRAFT_102700 [Volvox carteri f. nagariensis]|uniref:Major facilitator superfamily (MFS) profile domain-containing protein n=1 Tax=Volvox carteri f. nagariensis TaxID=3068 RepID=D8THI5_VOLCA|nr:uncharacterized protein VOLCADRAFT_102700 [Volvox carteri f. nagariensis]EFJ52717.1 hypothetical protein VOLCADRAFT_102700 [Volvox carteri f. nagariensis]|eukprot:XP_002945722.1 hypothetical protein VOLCADRAFT_102700 [Volvox carteri f. nagariensis]
MKYDRKLLLQSSTLYQLIVYGNVVLYSICWMAQVPVLPYLVERLGVAGSSAQYGTLQTIFSAVQFVGGLISGPLMDRYGGRFLFAVSFAASVASYGLTAMASSMWVLYISRIPTVLQHAVLASRAIVTQLSSEANRARVLGYVAVSYSVGFMVGPAVGGLLSAVSLQFAAWVATLGSALSLALVLLLLPDLPAHASEDNHHNHHNHRNHQGDRHELQQQPHHHTEIGQEGQRTHRHRTSDCGHDADQGGGSGYSAKARGGQAASPPLAGDLADEDGPGGGPPRVRGGARQMLMQFVEVSPKEVVRMPGVMDLLAGKLLVGLGSAVFQSMFPVLLKRRYGLDPRTNGMVMSYVGALLLGGQALLVGPVISAVGEAVTEYGCVAALVATYGALAAAGALWQLLLLLVPLSVAGMLYNNASTSRLTKATLPQQRGTALALDMSLSSGVRMLSPALGAAAVDRFGHRAQQQQQQRVCLWRSLNPAMVMLLMLVLVLVVGAKEGERQVDGFGVGSEGEERKVVMGPGSGGGPGGRGSHPNDLEQHYLPSGSAGLMPAS